jgi:hypothetical protein
VKEFLTKEPSEKGDKEIARLLNAIQLSTPYELNGIDTPQVIVPFT